MATGKELVRLVTCGFWKDEIENLGNLCGYSIFDKNGKRISLKTAELKSFCHIHILFKGLTTKEAKILSCFLNNIASTSSEQMCRTSLRFYSGFDLIIIS